MTNGFYFVKKLNKLKLMFCWLFFGIFGTNLALLGHFNLDGLVLHVQSLCHLYCGVTIYFVSNINCGLFNYVDVFVYCAKLHIEIDENGQH